MIREHLKIWYRSTAVLVVVVTLGMVISCFQASDQKESGLRPGDRALVGTEVGNPGVTGTEVGNPAHKNGTPGSLWRHSESAITEMLAENLDDVVDTMDAHINGFDAIMFMKQLP
jgi:hypothetical protein